MPIHVVWDNPEHRIIRQEFDGAWTWTEHSAAVDETHALMKTVPHRVHVIANMEAAPSLPSNALAYTRRNMTKAPDNAGITVVVLSGQATFVRTLLAAFARVYTALAQKLLVADNLETARELLRGKGNPAEP